MRDVLPICESPTMPTLRTTLCAVSVSDCAAEEARESEGAPVLVVGRGGAGACSCKAAHGGALMGVGPSVECSRRKLGWRGRRGTRGAVGGGPERRRWGGASEVSSTRSRDEGFRGCLVRWRVLTETYPSACCGGRGPRASARDGSLDAVGERCGRRRSRLVGVLSGPRGRREQQASPRAVQRPAEGDGGGARDQDSERDEDDASVALPPRTSC